jgi:hypothetical protein
MIVHILNMILSIAVLYILFKVIKHLRLKRQ